MLQIHPARLNLVLFDNTGKIDELVEINNQLREEIKMIQEK